MSAYRTLFEANPLPMWVFDIDTLRILNVNAAAVAHYGWSRDEFLQLTVIDVRVPEERDRFRRHMAERPVPPDPQPWSAGEWVHQRKDGTRLEVEITWSSLEFAGRPARLAVINDITVRRRLERDHLSALSEAIGARRVLQETLARIDDAFVALDRQWRFTYANERAVRLLGLGRGEMLPGLELWAVLPEARGQAWHRLCEEALACGSVRVRELQFAPSQRWLEVRAFPSAQGLSIYFTDVTERRDAESALRASEAHHRLVFDANPVPMWVYDLRTLRFLAVNRAAMRHYGYGRSEFLAMTIADIRPPEDLERLHQRLDSLEHRDHLHPSGLWTHRLKDGRSIVVEITSSDLHFEGRTARLVLARDVTEERRAQVALTRSERDFRLLAEQIPAIVYRARLDPAGYTDYVSPRVAELGFTPEDWIGRPDRLWNSMHPDDLDAVRARVDEAFRTAQDEVHLEYRMRDGSGRWRDVSDHARVVRPPDGQAPFVLGVNVDVTGARQAERALRRSEARLRSLAEQLPAILYRVPLPSKGPATYASAHIASLGYTVEEWTSAAGPNWRTCLHAEDAPRVLDQIARLDEAGPGHEDLVLEYRLRDRDGRWRHFIDHARVVAEPGASTTVLQGVMVEITGLKQTETALRDAQAYQRGLFEALADGVLLLDAHHRVLDANRAATVLLGHDRRALLSRDLGDLLVESQRLRLDETVGALLRASPPRLMEWDHLRGDGTSFPAEVSLRPLGDSRYVAVLRDVTERHNAERALATYQMELSELTQRLLRQERETTRRLAQALHDHLGQHLAISRLHLDAARAALGGDSPPGVARDLARASDTLAQAVADVRDALQDLRPPMLEEQGLAAALDNEIQARTFGHGHVDVVLEVEAAPGQRWPGDVEYAAFMIVREALVNAHLHAAATLVRVVVGGDDAHLLVEAIDDGRGLPAPMRGGRPGHLGLVGMRERALAIGGLFGVDAGPGGRGTRVWLRWEGNGT